MSPKTKEQYEGIREQSIRQILDGALIVFAKKGLAATKISDLAKECGISNGLIYNYFSSKEEVYALLIKEAVMSSTGALQMINKLEFTPVEKINYLSTQLLEALRCSSQTAYYFLMMIQSGVAGDLPVKVREELEGSDSSTHTLAKIIECGQQQGTIVEGKPWELAVLYFGAIQGLCISYVMGIQGIESIKAEHLNRILIKS